jgi:hypothetical protein
LLNRHNAQRLKQIEMQLAVIDAARDAVITQDASQRMSRLSIWLADV